MHPGFGTRETNSLFIDLFLLSEAYNSMGFERWMENLESKLKHVNICYLAIPGSHDSLSFSVTKNSTLSPDAPTIARILYKACKPLMKSIIYNWCVTQNANLEEQFTSGIRYFDLRVATKGMEIYSCHALYGMNIVEALKILNRLLDSYSQEIVILDFQHFYNFHDSHHILLTDQIRSNFGSKICPLPKNISILTVDHLQRNHSQVIVIYRDKWVEKTTDFWPSSKWLTLWPNTIDINKLLVYLTETLKNRPKDAGFVSQCLFTPPPRFIAFHLFSSLKRKCGINCDMKIKSLWLEKQYSLSSEGVNVIIADFIDLQDFDFCPIVVNINKKSLKYNEMSSVCKITSKMSKTVQSQ